MVGISLAPMNTAVHAGYLTGEFGREKLIEYNFSAKFQYGDSDLLNVLSFSEEDSTVIGANPFAVVLMNSLLPVGMRTASPADLEKMLHAGVDFRGSIIDSAIVLRNLEKHNSYLSNDIFAQLKRINPNVKLPQMIPLSAFKLKLDQDSPYPYSGLGLELVDGKQSMYVPILNEETATFESENIDLNTGLPNKLGSGTRKLWTIADGLSWMTLLHDGDWASDYVALGKSPKCRIVVVADSDLGAGKN